MKKGNVYYILLKFLTPPHLLETPVIRDLGVVFFLHTTPEISITKLPSIDPFQDIDPMLSNDVKQSDDNHLLAICDVTADELCYVEARFKKVTPHDTDSKYEDAEN